MRDDDRWRRYWRYLTSGFRQDVDDELAFHLEMRAAELRRQGLPADQARHEAERRFGDRTQIRTTLQRIERKRGRQMKLAFLGQEVAQDIRYGVRGLSKRPGFALMTASSLALGIAAATVVLSVIDAFLLRPLPVRDPNEVVVVGASNRSLGSLVAGVIGLPTVKDIAARNDLFQGVSATSFLIAAARSSPTEPAERGAFLAVTGNYFSVLGLAPAAGRLLTPGDDQERQRVVVLSHRMWTTRFGGEPSAVGRTIRINTVEFTVVGVTPRGFTGTEHVLEPSGYLPVGALDALQAGALEGENRRAPAVFTVIARRQPDRSVAAIGSALGVLAKEIEASYPEVGEQYRLVTVPELRARPNLPSAGAMTGVAAVFATLALLVLVTASVNATNLILARGSTQATELAVRQALGASRSRVVRQQLTEAVLVTLLALGGGLALARLAINALTSIPVAIDGLSLRFGIELDFRVFSMAALVALVTGLVAGLGPALTTSRFALQQRLREGGRAGASRGGRRVRNALVVAQVAASLVVLVCAGLFLGSAKRAARVDLGFRPDQVLTLGVDAGLAHYDEPAARLTFERIRVAVEQVPGVVAAVWANAIPIKKGGAGMAEVEADGGAKVGAFTAAVGPGYFGAMEMPILQGRGFAATDDTASAGIVIVNRKMAETLWPGASPLGRSVRLSSDGPPLEVVGVVKDGRYLTIAESPRPYLFRPLSQAYTPAVYLHVRTAGNPAGLLEPVRAAVARVDPDLAPFDVETLERALATSPNGTLLFQVGAGFATAIGLLAVALTLVGLYGVIVMSVTQRTREIGLRMALGATRGAVVRSVLLDGAKLAGWGILVGLVGAAIVTRMLGGLLIGGRSGEAMIFGLVAAGLAAAALLSTYLPARRAARIDPVKALSES